MADVRRLPIPVSTTWDWQLHAACRDVDSATFFHPALERGPAAAARDRAAKQICSGCPVIDACLRHALSVREPYGVWGGLTPGERGEILRDQFLWRAHRDASPAPHPPPDGPAAPDAG